MKQKRGQPSTSLTRAEVESEMEKAITCGDGMRAAALSKLLADPHCKFSYNPHI